MAAVAANILQAEGVYRFPGNGIMVYIVFTNIRWIGSGIIFTGIKWTGTGSPDSFLAADV